MFYKTENPENYMKLLTNYSFDRQFAVKTIQAEDTALEILYNKQKKQK